MQLYLVLSRREGLGFLRLNFIGNFSEVNSVSVNYAIRPSDPVTALTARYGVGPDLICQPGPSPGIKKHSSPAAFPTTLSLSFCSLPLSHLPAPPPHASGRAELHLLPC